MRALVTGALGNLGISITKRLLDNGYNVTGIDNNGRNSLLGGDVKGNIKYLKSYLQTSNNSCKFNLEGFNIADAPWHKIKGDFDVIVHCAAQVSHPKSIDIPGTDFMINALGTFKLLNYVRRVWPNTKFIHIGTAKIYGENVDRLCPYREDDTRYWYTDYGFHGVDEHCSFDQTMKTPFGCSKACADLYVQEYGRLYGLNTVVLRPGVFTGPYAKPVIWQNWLGDLCKEILTQDHVDIIGYNGKQVRDILHTEDLVDAIMLMLGDMPAKGEVFNIGGGRDNAISVIEAFRKICVMAGGQRLPTLGFLPKREGDWQVYVTDNSKLQNRYPRWSISRSLDHILNETLESTRTIASE